MVHLGSFAYISVFSAHIFPTPATASEDSFHRDTYQMIYEPKVIPSPPSLPECCCLNSPGPLLLWRVF